MAKTYEELLEQAAIIRDETAAGKNTATRVGGTITDAVDYVKELQDTYKGIHAEAAAAKTEAAAAKTTAEQANRSATNAFDNSRSAVLTANAANSTANEAKTTADEAQTAAQLATSNATEAKTIANNAANNATAAKATADAASTSAQDAKTTATDAKATAEQAKQSATNAFDNARSALLTANAAQSTADGIAATAQEAKEAAAAAQTAAETAQTIAQEAKETVSHNYKYPNIPKDEFYNLTRKYYISNFYFTPERNVRRLTGISFIIRSGWIPTDSVKIVAYKPNDVIILKEITATGGINEITFEEPITCDDEHEIAVFLTTKPGDNSWYLYNYDGGVWYTADGTEDFQPQSNYSSSYNNTLIGVQFYNNVSISEEVDELKKKTSYYVTNEEFATVKSLAESKADDSFANKMVVFSGDSWSQGTYESRSKVYRTVFAALHPSCIVEDKTCISGSTIADRGAGLGSISTRVKGRIEKYGDKFVNSYYPLTTSDNLSTATAGGRIILDVDRLDYLRFKFDSLGVLHRSVRIYFYSYNQSNSKYTELTNVGQYVEGMTDANSAIVTIMLASQVKALDGETLAIKLKYENIDSWTDTNVKVVNDASKQYNIEGVLTSGSPLLTYGYKGDMNYLIIEGGLNDCYGSCPLGVLSEGYDDTYDRTTFYGALEDMFSDIVKKSPSTKAGFIIMPMADSPNWGTYVEAIKAACDKWGIMYLDLDGLMRARLVGMGLNSDSIYWSIYPDGNTNPHPSAYGYEMMNSKIFGWIDTL